jgi:hypothetical protein
MNMEVGESMSIDSMSIRSISYETDYSPDEIMAESSSRLKPSGYRISQEGNYLLAKDGRDYSTWVIVVSVILILTFTLIGIVVLIVYWFTRTQNAISVDASPPGKFTIKYQGKKATEEALGLSNVLRSPKSTTPESPQAQPAQTTRARRKRTTQPQPLQAAYCPYCGAPMVQGATYCTNCGRELS